MWSLQVWKNSIHTCKAYIVKSNNGSKEQQVIQSNQDVHVYGYIWWCEYVVEYSGNGGRNRKGVK